MTDEQPETFFLRVWLKALAVASGDAIAFKPKQDYAAALAIQRAFAEREADLVGALKAVLSELECKGGDGWMTGNVHGDDFERATAALAALGDEA